MNARALLDQNLVSYWFFSGKGNRQRNLVIAVGAGVLAGGVAVVAAPIVIGGALGALGFTAGGIAANSVAAGMMSSAAIANGGGVVAGGVVATLQSVGAAGIAASTQAAIGGAVGTAVGSITALFNSKGKKSSDK